MRTGDNGEALVKVLVRVPGPGPNVEGMWATPVDATDAGGTYRLRNNGFLCPLVIDDVVEAQLDGDGQLQVTGVRERGGRAAWFIELHGRADKSDIHKLIDAWAETGTAVEGSHRALSVALDPAAGDRGRPALTELAQLQLNGLVASILPLSNGSELTAVEAAEFDFRLRREPSPELQRRHTTTYWVGDDPYWAEHGLADPGFLAYVQRLAHEDVQVARALELGKHHQVLRYIEVLSMSPSQWAELGDERIFDEEDTSESERRA